MNKRGYLRIVGVALVVAGALLTGCSSSEEAQQSIQPAEPSATEQMQRDMAILRSRNDSLLILVNRLERDNQMATARAVEAETQLGEMKTRMASAQTTATKPKPRMTTGGGSYEQGLQLFHAHKYDEAAAQFQGVLDAGNQAELEDNCHYWLGECAYAAKSYKEAIDHFNEVITYKISEKKDDAQMMIANSYLAMGNTERAKAEYQKLIDKYPASTYIARAKEKLGKL